MSKESEIIFGVPGKWQTHGDIVRDIANKSDGLLYAGLILMDTATKAPFKLEVYEQDPVEALRPISPRAFVGAARRTRPAS